MAPRPDYDAHIRYLDEKFLRRLSHMLDEAINTVRRRDAFAASDLEHRVDALVKDYAEQRTRLREARDRDVAIMHKFSLRAMVASFVVAIAIAAAGMLGFMPN